MACHSGGAYWLACIFVTLLHMAPRAACGRPRAPAGCVDNERRCAARARSDDFCATGEAILNCRRTCDYCDITTVDVTLRRGECVERQTSSIPKDDYPRQSLEFTWKLLKHYEQKYARELLHLKRKHHAFSPAVLQANVALLLYGARGKTEDQLRSFAFHLYDRKDVSKKAIVEKEASVMKHVNNESKKVRTETIMVMDSRFMYKQFYREAGFSCFDAFPFLCECVSSKPARTAHLVSKLSRKVNKRVLFPNIARMGESEEPRILIASSFTYDSFYARPPAWFQRKTLPFTTASGLVLPVAALRTRQRLIYRNIDTWLHMVGLEFEGLSQTLYLFSSSTERMSTSQLIKRLSPSSLHRLIVTAQPADVDLTFPAFALSSSVQLGEALRAAGAGDALSPAKANFGSIYQTTVHTRRDTLHLQDVHHWVTVEVTEEGMGGRRARPAGRVDSAPYSVGKTHTVVIDQPFVFFVRDSVSGAILVAGAVHRPEE